MNSIEFGKVCKPYNLRYKEIFGYIPNRDDYLCNQNEYFEALVKSINQKKEIGTFLIKKNRDRASGKKY